MSLEYSSILHTLFTGIQYLKGIGEKRREAYARLGCRALKDLLFHFPTGVIDRTKMLPLSPAIAGKIVTQIVNIDYHNPPSIRSRKVPYKIHCSNETGNLTIVYFNAYKSYLEKTFPVGKKVAVSGKLEYNLNDLQMVHPDLALPSEQLEEVQRVEPVYPLTYGITSRCLGVAIQNAIEKLPEIPEWLDDEIIEKYEWGNWANSVKRMHAPESENDIVEDNKAKERLAFDELLAQQIRLQFVRGDKEEMTKLPLKFEGKLVEALKAILPFELTPDQLSVIHEISNDQKSGQRMMRLLQGDVGSGKTLVAFCAMLNAVEVGKQAALMCPTEILARQHFAKLKELCDKLKITIELLTGKQKSREKRSAANSMKFGIAEIVVGTHALFQESVEFHNLGLVVTDEQHRFGVKQRAALIEKGMNADFMMMSATPIPRTLAMIGYGDLDVSTIRSKPDNRLPIKTSVISQNRMNEVVGGIGKAIADGAKVYWVCPLIEESEKMELSNVMTRFEMLKEMLDCGIGLVHSQIPQDEKDEIMSQFVEGEIKVLVATTVIEVGVDVPDATVMVIENAERFGLSQLHQLRGRVGRGEKQSYCMLLYKNPLGWNSKERLMVIRDSQDGFEIAEKDLALRGSGEIVGTRQSGMPAFKACNLSQHGHLVPEAVSYARRIMKKEGRSLNQKLDLLMKIYEYDYGYVG